MSDALPQTVTTAEAARLLGITPERLGQLARAGLIPRAGRGRVELAGAIAGYIDSIRESATRATKSAAQDRVAAARAAEIQQRMAVRDRSLIPMAEAIGVVDQVVAVVRLEAAALPARISRDLIVRKKAEAEVHAMLHAVSRALAARSAAIKGGS